MKIKNLILPWFLVLGACAPQVQNRDYPNPNLEFGPVHDDTDLKLDSLKTTAVTRDVLAINGLQGNAQIFRAAENLMVLSETDFGDNGVNAKVAPRLANLGQYIIQSFYESKAVNSRSAFENSLYVSAAIGEAQPDAKGAIFNAVQLLDEQLEKVLDVVDQSQTAFRWPDHPLQAGEAIPFVQSYLNWLLDTWKQSHLDPRVMSGLVDGISERATPEIQTLQGYVTSFQTATKLSDFLATLRAAMSFMGYTPDDDTKTQLTKGDNFATLFNNAKNEGDALKVLIEVWKVLTPDERISEFKAVSSELYDVLKGSSNNELKCLEGDDCGIDILTIIKRDSFIKPKIKDYGVEKMIAQVNKGAIDYATTFVMAAVTPILKAQLIPALKDDITKGFKDEEVQLAAISRDLKTFLGPSLAKWAKNVLLAPPDGLQGVEASTSIVKVTSRLDMSFGSASKATTITTGADVLGSSMSAMATKWDMQQPDLMKIDPGTLTNKAPSAQASIVRGDLLHTHIQEMLSQINKALAIGGFIGLDNSLSPAYAKAIDEDDVAANDLDLESFVDSPFSFAVADKVDLIGPYLPKRITKDQKNVSVNEQAAVLSGLSKMARFFRDWEPNSFDRFVGSINVDQIVDDPRLKGIDQKFFPKDLFFTLMVGNAGVILENLNKNMTPVLMIDDAHHTSWINSTAPSDPDHIASMATLVNIVAGQRAQVADTAALSRYLLSVADFIDATDGIEKTGSAILNKKGSDGKTTLDALTAGREKLKSLIPGIANFLTHEMQAKDGGMYHGYDMNAVAHTNDPRNLIDQVMAIRALAKAFAITGGQVYKNAALDIYFYMNKNLWNATACFYSDTPGAKAITDLFTMSETLLSIQRLKPLMPVTSAAQWTRITKLWANAIDNF